MSTEKLTPVEALLALAQGHVLVRPNWRTKEPETLKLADLDEIQHRLNSGYLVDGVPLDGWVIDPTTLPTWCKGCGRQTPNRSKMGCPYPVRKG
jgi:hypothetical protein